MSQQEREQLRAEVERLRQAAETALEQLDWCIGYFHGGGKTTLAAALARNRTSIREHVMQVAPQPTPSHPSKPTRE